MRASARMITSALLSAGVVTLGEWQKNVLEKERAALVITMHDDCKEEIKRRAIIDANNLVTTAKKRKSLVFERPGAYLAMVEQLKSDVASIGDLVVVYFMPAPRMSDLWRDVEMLAYICESIRHYINGGNAALYRDEVIEHGRMLKAVWQDLNHAQSD